MESFQDIVDAMLSSFGIIPSITAVIFPLTFLTFFIVSWLDSSTTIKRGVRLFFYIGAPINIAALLIIVMLTYAGVINHTYVSDAPTTTTTTYVDTITVDTSFNNNNPHDISTDYMITTTSNITLTKDNTPSEIEYLSVGDEITVNTYAADQRNLFTPADPTTIYTLTIHDELPK